MKYKLIMQVHLNEMVQLEYILHTKSSSSSSVDAALLPFDDAVLLPSVDAELLPFEDVEVLPLDDEELLPFDDAEPGSGA